MEDKTILKRSERIINELKEKYPSASVWDVDGSGKHFVAEVEPSKDHPEYDRAIEVIISSKPHKHLKMIQEYKVIVGDLELHLGDRVVILCQGEKHIIRPGIIHWANGDECWVEIYSTPGWTKEDHIQIE
jgi:hypothetical protein